MIVKFKDKNKNIGEIYSAGMEYSLLNDKYEGLHDPIRCKDFITDIFWGETLKKDVNIYSFRYIPTNYFKDKELLLLGIRNEWKVLSEVRENLESFLNKFEENLGFEESVVIADDTDLYLVIEFDKNWTNKPYLISLFTLLVRIGIDYNNEPIEDFLNKVTKSNTNDAAYVFKIKNTILNIYKGEEFTQTYEEYTDINRVHNNSGIVNFTPKTIIESL